MVVFVPAIQIKMHPLSIDEIILIFVLNYHKTCSILSFPSRVVVILAFLIPGHKTVYTPFLIVFTLDRHTSLCHRGRTDSTNGKG